MYPKIIGQITGDSIIVQDGKEHIVGFRPIDRDFYDSWTNPEDPCGDAIDYIKELWQGAVAENMTEESLVEYATNLIALDGGEVFWDYGYYDLWNVLREAGLNEESWPVFNCVMCGFYDSEKDVFDKFDIEDWS